MRPRTPIATTGWGVVIDPSTGLPRASEELVLRNLDGSDAKVYAALTGAAELLAPILTGADGVWPGFVEGDTYLLTEPIDNDERRVEAIVGHTARVTFEAFPTLDSLGAVGNDIDDDSAAIAQAVATGIVHQLLPGRRYRTSAPVQLVTGGGLVGHNKFQMEDLWPTNYTDVRSEIRGMEAGEPVIVLPRGITTMYSQHAAVKLDGLGILANGGTCIDVPNGALGVDIGDVVVTPGAGGKAVHHKGFIQDWRVKHLRSYGGKYGWYCDAEDAEDLPVGAEGKSCRMDSCNMGLFLSGASKYSGHMRVPIADTNTLRLRIVTSAEHGFVCVGGFAGLVLDNLNTEANGLSQYSTTPIHTTGAITVGTNLLTVASAAGFAPGQTICVQGAGQPAYAEATEGPRDLVTTISSIAGSVLTLANNALVTVAAADVTRALYSDFYCGVDLGSPEGLGTTLSGGPGNVTFVSPSWGLSNYLRYAADLSGVGYGLKVINPKQAVRPVYDPLYRSTPDQDPLNYAQYRPTRKWQLIDDSANGGLNRFATGWASDTGQACAVRRIGRTVEFRGRAIASAGATTTVCTLPLGCRPSRNIINREIFYDDYTQAVGVIYPTGVCDSQSVVAGTTVFADGQYFTVD